MRISAQVATFGNKTLWSSLSTRLKLIWLFFSSKIEETLIQNNKVHMYVSTTYFKTKTQIFSSYASVLVFLLIKRPSLHFSTSDVFKQLWNTFFNDLNQSAD